MDIIRADRFYYAARGIVLRVAISFVAVVGIFAALIFAIFFGVGLIGW